MLAVRRNGVWKINLNIAVFDFVFEVMLAVTYLELIGLVVVFLCMFFMTTLKVKLQIYKKQNISVSMLAR